MTVKRVDTSEPTLNFKIPKGTLAAALASCDRIIATHRDRLGPRGEAPEYSPRTPPKDR